ncbi:MAG: type II toxin-antitoxin system RelE/ParE family toxin [Thermoanaerobaculia bacterium]
MTSAPGFHPAAADEAEAAVGWYEERREGLGDEFRAALDETVELIAKGVLRGPKVRRRGVIAPVRRVVLSRFPYDVIYLEGIEGATIIAVAHHSRRPGFWKSRI